MDPYRYCSIRFSNPPLLRFLVSQELPKYWVGERVSWHYGTTKKVKLLEEEKVHEKYRILCLSIHVLFLARAFVSPSLPGWHTLEMRRSWRDAILEVKGCANDDDWGWVINRLSYFTPSPSLGLLNCRQRGGKEGFWVMQYTSEAKQRTLHPPVPNSQNSKNKWQQYRFGSFFIKKNRSDFEIIGGPSLISVPARPKWNILSSSLATLSRNPHSSGARDLTHTHTHSKVAKNESKQLLTHLIYDPTRMLPVFRVQLTYFHMPNAYIAIKTIVNK